MITSCWTLLSTFTHFLPYSSVPMYIESITQHAAVERCKSLNRFLNASSSADSFHRRFGPCTPGDHWRVQWRPPAWCPRQICSERCPWTGARNLLGKEVQCAHHFIASWVKSESGATFVEDSRVNRGRNPGPLLRNECWWLLHAVLLLVVPSNNKRRGRLLSPWRLKRAHH